MPKELSNKQSIKKLIEDVFKPMDDAEVESTQRLTLAKVAILSMCKTGQVPKINIKKLLNK